jgi:hypothetical protein
MTRQTYYELTLAAPGGPGERSEATGEGIFKDYASLHAIFESWLGDEMVEILPCFLVTSSLGAEFVASGFTGFELLNVEVERDGQFDLAYPGVELPHFSWLKITGVVGKDDFFVTEGHNLAVSKRAFDVIEEANLPCMTFEEFFV